MKDVVSPATIKGDYDVKYQRRDEAVIAGIVIALVVIWFRGKNISWEFAWHLTAVIHLAASYWTYNIAKEQNRAPLGWALLGLLYPPLALIWLGRTKKLKFHLLVDKTFPIDVQYQELQKLGRELVGRKKYPDALVVYEYIMEHTPHTEEDSKILKHLRMKVYQNNISS